MKLPEPQSRTFSNLVGDIEKGQIKIPQFQRDFVWEIAKSVHLIDSIIKGYPIGTFIFWRTNERLRAVRNLGNTALPEPPDGEYVDYILDGQQRLTSLYASLKGISITRKSGKVDNFSEIYVNLEAEEDDQIVISDISGKDPSTVIKITDLLNGDFVVLGAYPSEYHKKMQEYQLRIKSYTYSIIQIKETPIDIATEVFTRINVGGKSLSVFEIMIAKTYDPEKGFDLAEKYQELIEELRPLDYETISDATVLQTISVILTKDCTRKTILKLEKQSFIEVWNDAVKAIESAVEYFRLFYRIPVSQLLPYHALVIPFAYYFYNHPDKPIGDQQRYLEDFFWRCSLTGRYSSGLESKMFQDIRKIDLILKGEQPKYEWAVNTSAQFIIDNGWFNAGKSFIKAILCLYAYQEPKSFIDNSKVNISNYWLKQANSKNYHHFFPRAYLRKKKEDEFYINHILNITIVDDFLNKRLIRDLAPSVYMTKFNQNKKLDETMRTHLISDLNDFGVLDDNYGKFFEQRAALISKELEARVVPQAIDAHAMHTLPEEETEDIEEIVDGTYQT